jgi:hypothetical protein
MAIVGTEFSTNVQAAELAFFDVRQSSILSTFDESHGDDITEVSKNMIASITLY